MTDLSIRPRFKLETSLTESQIKQLFDDQLKNNNTHGFIGSMKHGHLILRLPKNKKHFWSPQLDVSFISEENKTILNCLITPEPGIWTFFMFVYILSGFGTLIGLMIGTSQYSLDKETWGYWIAIASALLGIIFYIVAQTGKRLALDNRKAFYYFIKDLIS